MVRTWCVSHLASWLRTRRFREPTFRPSGASNHWKNTVFRDFPIFSRTCIFFLLPLSLLWSSLCCSSLLFFDSYHLCFSSVHIVGSLTSKLPSVILIDFMMYLLFYSILFNQSHANPMTFSQRKPAPSVSSMGSTTTEDWLVQDWLEQNLRRRWNTWQSTRSRYRLLRGKMVIHYVYIYI